VESLYLLGMINHLVLPSPPLQEAATSATAVAFQVAADVSAIVLAVVAILFMTVTIVILAQLKKLLGSLQSQVQPVTDRARVAAENVEYISAVVREDVQRVHASVAGLSDRLKAASERMEERVEEFNALMDVVQDEAESVLLDTAAVVQGVRAGARIVGDGLAKPPRAEATEEDSDLQPGATEGTSGQGEVTAREERRVP